MYLGRLCEVGPSEQLFARPRAPLYRATHRGDPGAGSGRTARRNRAGRGTGVADFAALGLPFRTRCPERTSDVSRKFRSFARLRQTSSPLAIIH